jgi:hypothetical protein
LGTTRRSSRRCASGVSQCVRRRPRLGLRVGWAPPTRMVFVPHWPPRSSSLRRLGQPNVNEIENAGFERLLVMSMAAYRTKGLSLLRRTKGPSLEKDRGPMVLRAQSAALLHASTTDQAAGVSARSLQEW